MAKENSKRKEYHKNMMKKDLRRKKAETLI